MVGFRAVVYIHMHQEDAMPTVEPLDSREEKVVTAVREARDEIIALASELISYDTTARNPSEPARRKSLSRHHWPVDSKLRARPSTCGNPSPLLLTHASFPPVSYTHLTLPTNREV